MYNKDTIVARATPPGRGGVGILRISGPKVIEVAKIILGKLPIPRYADYLPFYDANHHILDQGIALYFERPNSFTGEDILELHCHGGMLIIDLLIKQILGMGINGIRIAKPGEFSERAFLNDKIDLVQAEAIADIIDASTEQAARSAANSLQGYFSQQISKIVEELNNLRIYVEAAIDFPEDEIDFLSDKIIETKLVQVISNLEIVFLQTYQGKLLRDGIKVVLTGPPNVGKSSLLNALSGNETAIVTNIAGTTRDLLHEYIHIDGMPLHIIDTAGLREATDIIEKIGIDRAYQEIKKADYILLIIDSTTTKLTEMEQIISEFVNKLPKSKSMPTIMIIRNKVDITAEPIGITNIGKYFIISLSAKLNQGIDLLREYLKNSIGFNTPSIEDGFLARQRHIQSLNSAKEHLQQAYNKLTTTGLGLELLSEQLKLAQSSLNEITGKFCSSSDLLKCIFSSFCIGK